MNFLKLFVNVFFADDCDGKVPVPVRLFSLEPRGAPEPALLAATHNWGGEKGALCHLRLGSPIGHLLPQVWGSIHFIFIINSHYLKMSSP